MLNQKLLTEAQTALGYARSNPTIMGAVKSDSAVGVMGHVVSVNVTNYNNLVKSESVKPDALATATAELSQSVGYYNALAINDRLKTLALMSEKDAFIDYLKNQTVTGKKVAYSDAGLVYTEDKTLDVSFADWLRVCRPEAKNSITNAAIIFADKCARVKTRTDENETGAVCVRKPLDTKYIDIGIDLGWNDPDDKLSKTVLKGYYQTLMSRFVLPRDLTVNAEGKDLRMLGADFKFVYNSVVTTVNRTNQGGKYVVRNTETVLGFLFRSVYNRYYGIPYDWQDQEKKQAKTATKAEEKPAAKAEEKSAPAEKAPAKTAAKKTTTKKTATKKAAAAATK